MERKIPIKTIYLLLVISIGLIALGVGSTYAIFTAEANIDNPISFTSNLLYTGEVLETVEVTVPAGDTISTTLNISNTTSDTLYYTSWYIDQGYSVDFDISTNTGTPTGSLTSGSSTSLVVDIRNNENNSITVVLGISSNTNSVVLGSGMTAIPSSRIPVNLVTYISNLYTNANKTVVKNNSIEYNYATEVSLMNDRLGGTTTDYDRGNIRYYGASPSNYIYFNCETYPETNCEKWRIIGVFKEVDQSDGTKKDLVKIISDSSIGNYSWDYTSTGSLDNNWSDSTLMKMLNNGYYNNSDGVVYYNGSTTAITINFATSNKGLKNDTTRNMIETVTWNLGGWNTAIGVYPNELYEYERGDKKCSSCTYETIWDGKIALMYPSDYGYATDFNKCTKDPYNYDTTTDCKGNDWLFNSANQWLLTPDSVSASHAWYVDSSGFLFYSNYVGYSFGVRPVFYLNSELSIGSGTGTSGDPYRISV